MLFDYVIFLVCSVFGLMYFYERSEGFGIVILGGLGLVRGRIKKIFHSGYR